jgi:hypothetical protein
MSFKLKKALSPLIVNGTVDRFSAALHVIESNIPAREGNIGQLQQQLEEWYRKVGANPQLKDIHDNAAFLAVAGSGIDNTSGNIDFIALESLSKKLKTQLKDRPEILEPMEVIVQGLMQQQENEVRHQKSYQIVNKWRTINNAMQEIKSEFMQHASRDSVRALSGADFEFQQLLGLLGENEQGTYLTADQHAEVKSALTAMHEGYKSEDIETVADYVLDAMKRLQK